MKRYLESHRFNLMLGAIAISFSPLAVKVVTFSPSVGAFYRAFYAAIFFLIFALWKQRTVKAFNPEFWFKNKLWILPSIVAGIFLGVDLILWHKTIVYLGAGPATFLGNSQIIFVTVFASLVFRERIAGVFYVFVAIILSGLYMLLPSEPVNVSLSVGYVMGLCVGLTYAGMLIALRYAKMSAKEDYPELWSLFYVFAVSALIIALYAVGVESGRLISNDFKSHFLMALTSLFAQTLGWYFITINISHVPAHEGSMVLMIQPVLATVWGVFLFREPLGISQITGIIISLTGIVMYQIKLTNRLL